jgi:hypothetical protein
MTRAFATALLIFVLGFPASQARAQTLYGADGYNGNLSTLYTIDTATGAATPIGPIGYPVTGLAFDPVNGVMYGATSSTTAANGLITINLDTGAGTLVGNYGLAGSTWLGDITIDSSGVLYGFVEPTLGDLYRIDKATGAATFVGDSGLSRTGILGLDFDSSGTLYLNTVGFMYTVNPTTGAVAPVGTEQARPLALALEFDGSNVLFGLEMPGFNETLRTLVRIDVATGNYTVIGATPGAMDALAFGPDRTITFPTVNLTGQPRDQKNKPRKGEIFTGTFEIEEFTVDDDAQICALGTVDGQIQKGNNKPSKNNKPPRNQNGGQTVADYALELCIFRFEVGGIDEDCWITGISFGHESIQVQTTTAQLVNIALAEAWLDADIDLPDGTLKKVICFLGEETGYVDARDIPEILYFLEELGFLPEGETADELLQDLADLLNFGDYAPT